MKNSPQVLPDAQAPAVVLSEARKWAAFNALRQRYEAHEAVTGVKSAEAFEQLRAGKDAG